MRFSVAMGRFSVQFDHVANLIGMNSGFPFVLRITSVLCGEIGNFTLPFCRLTRQVGPSSGLVQSFLFQYKAVLGFLLRCVRVSVCVLNHGVLCCHGTNKLNILMVKHPQRLDIWRNV